MLRIVALVVLIFGFSAQAEIITNGHLTITIRNDNGAIDSYVMDGVDYFGQGTHVYDWGVQIGSDTSTFRINSTNGGTAIPVSVTKVSANQVDVTGIITWAGKNVSFVRSIKVSDSQNAMLFSYVLTNNDLFDPVEISVFETFDPDQGIVSGGGYGTYNDVVTFGGLRVAQAVSESGLTFMIGTADSRMTLAAGSPFSISSGSGLNNFFASPYDGEGMFDDEGVHIGLRVTLEAGEETTSVAAAGSAQNTDATVAGDAISDIATGLVADILETDLVNRIIKTVQDEGPSVTTQEVTTTDTGGAVEYSFLLVLFAFGWGMRRSK